MNKPDQVRELLENAVPHLKRNPDSLHIFVEAGSVYATGAGLNLSFEYQFNLVIVATDYPEHADRIIVPLLAWCRTNQPELLMNPDRRNGFRFRAEQLNNKTADVEITLALTERVKVYPDENGVVKVEHPPEPPLLDAPDGITWQLLVNGADVQIGDHGLIYE
ncbi:phage tail protein [uncultured Tolumonas sp.]|uniref:phage tail protein n=1 Tax=uncultured Tolumonas sp. TaxID=263765 RepID=UPI002A0A6709|nr:phage tail protein [uncultured Tolumonas sp.]